MVVVRVELWNLLCGRLMQFAAFLMGPVKKSGWFTAVNTGGHEARTASVTGEIQDWPVIAGLSIQVRIAANTAKLPSFCAVASI
jgi:hypothetical protein